MKVECTESWEKTSLKFTITVSSVLNFMCTVIKMIRSTNRSYHWEMGHTWKKASLNSRVWKRKRCTPLNLLLKQSQENSTILLMKSSTNGDGHFSLPLEILRIRCIPSMILKALLARASMGLWNWPQIDLLSSSMLSRLSPKRRWDQMSSRVWRWKWKSWRNWNTLASCQSRRFMKPQIVSTLSWST